MPSDPAPFDLDVTDAPLSDAALAALASLIVDWLEREADEPRS